MAEKVTNQFNLVEEKWIPIANHGLVSLVDIFSQKWFTALEAIRFRKSLSQNCCSRLPRQHTPRKMMMTGNA